MAGSQANGATIAAIDRALGLDKPLPVQYGIYIVHLLHGNMGVSNRDQAPVALHIAAAFGPTLWLTLASMIVAILVGLVAGVVASVHHNRFLDYTTTSAAMFGISLPSFVLGLALIWIFAVDLRWFPTGGNGSPSALVLPAITLGAGAAATIARITRSEMLDVLGQDYVRTARAKGQRESIIVNRHALRNALIPIVTVIGLQFGFLISGAIIVETVFTWPGIGRLLIDSITLRDYPVIQGVILVFALEFIVVNLLTDVLYTRVDPRIRYS